MSFNDLEIELTDRDKKFNQFSLEMQQINKELKLLSDQRSERIRQINDPEINRISQEVSKLREKQSNIIDKWNMILHITRKEK
jgi:hypothetical protein